MFNGGMHTFSPRLSITVENSAQRAHPLERPLERDLPLERETIVGVLVCILIVSKSCR
jgi:hypothetical protein